MNEIRDLGYDVLIENEKDISYNDNLKDVEVLVCYNPFKTLDITKLRNLKWIQLSSIGVDQVPIEHLKKNNIILTNNKGGYSIPMGEWIVMKSLELLKNSKTMYLNQSVKKWHMDTSVLEIFGKTIGFIGTGSIAIEAAKRFQGFGVNVIGLNTRGRHVEYFDKCYMKNELKLMLPLCDIVILTIPYTEDTHHMINEDTLKFIKKTAYLINVSRGSIVDEVALIKYLKKGVIKGAALDVFEEEPLDKNSPLWDLDNVIITAHNSWVSEMRNIRRYDMIYENMRRYINGESLKNVVNLCKGY